MNSSYFVKCFPICRYSYSIKTLRFSIFFWLLHNISKVLLTDSNFIYWQNLVLAVLLAVESGNILWSHNMMKTTPLFLTNHGLIATIKRGYSSLWQTRIWFLVFTNLIYKRSVLMNSKIGLCDNVSWLVFICFTPLFFFFFFFLGGGRWEGGE